MRPAQDGQRLGHPGLMGLAVLALPGVQHPAPHLDRSWARGLVTSSRAVPPSGPVQSGLTVSASTTSS